MRNKWLALLWYFSFKMLIIHWFV